MKKYILIIVSLFIVSYVSAQDTDAIMKLTDKLADNKIEIANLKKQINHVEDSLNVTIKTLKDQIESGKQAKAKVEKEKQDSISYYRNVIKSKNSTITTLNNKIASLNEKNGKLESDKASIQASTTRMDEKIIMMCLMYPTVTRYSQKLIDEALLFLEQSDVKSNPAYKKYFDAYTPLLGQYSKFNTQIIDVLNKISKRLIKFNWKVDDGDFKLNLCLDDLKKIEYYKYYLKRNNPHQSIKYLDEVIDEFVVLMNEGGTINQKRYQNIIDKLQPKN